MLKQFNTYRITHCLFNSDDTILVAVSGGIDSMVLLDLFIKSGFNIGIAHCNFGLRGEESDGDMLLVEAFAKKNIIPFFSICFNTEEYANQNSLSIQMAARELRYNWFEKIRKENNYNCIAIAHNKEDVVETFLLNLSRGTGIKGLTGIKNKNGNIIRPLMFACREEIIKYGIDHKISYREDSSNASVKYKRNKIRHRLIPLFKELNPDFINTIIANIDRLADSNRLISEYISTIKKELIKENNDSFRINCKELIKYEARKTILYELIQSFGFNEQQIDDIIEIIINGVNSGKQFFSSTHRLLVDRNEIIITILKKEEVFEIVIDQQTNECRLPFFTICFSKIIKDNTFSIQPESDIAQIDFERLSFPLVIRKWREGDSFVPLGMKNEKKLSDFFIDNKFSIVEKENTWLLTSNEEIVWVIGKRLDDRFKINTNTKYIYMVETIKGLDC